jgi:hypothetical protein
MRVIWVVGAEASTFDLLKKVFEPERLGGVSYVLKFADTPQNVDEKDFANPGVIALLDAFSIASPGFEGVKTLRSQGFQGPIFLFGEPALEMAIEPFKNLKLSGFFPSFDRADLHFASSAIHHQLYYEGEVNLGSFLIPGGRSSIETINTFKDFSNFGVKIATFLGKFGIDLNQLKRLLLGLTLPHIKTHSGNPQVEQPFAIHYGVDKKKVILAVSTFSRGATKEALLSDFCEVLGALKTSKPPQGTIFPELNHVARASENLLLFAGSAFETQAALDPITLLAFLPFPKNNTEKATTQSIFEFSYVCRTPEYEEINPESESQQDKPPESTSDLPAESLNQNSTSSLERDSEFQETDSHQDNSTIEAPTTESLLIPETNQSVSPVGTIENVDASAILQDDPTIIGDTPREVDPYAPATPEQIVVSSQQRGFSETVDGKAQTQKGSEVENQNFSSVGVIETQVSSVDESEFLKMKDLVSTLSQDVRRLMKERRTPTTDKELRESYTKIEEKLKIANAEKMKLEEEIKDKLKLIETLKAQVETLSRTKAA